MIVPAEIEKLDEVTAFIDAFLEEHDCPMKIQMQIDLCLEEMFVNIAHYAYPAEILVSESGGTVTITLIDSGLPYDPLKKEDPDITLGAEERQIGGLGIFLVKKNMDAVSYRYEDGKNIFTMQKAIA